METKQFYCESLDRVGLLSSILKFELNPSNHHEDMHLQSSFYFLCIVLIIPLCLHYLDNSCMLWLTYFKFERQVIFA